MTGFLALGGVMLAGFAFLSLILAFFMFLFKAVFWLVALPFRIVFWVLSGAFALVGAAIGLVIALAFGLAFILAPLLPFAILAAMVYGIIRLIKRPAVT